MLQSILFFDVRGNGPEHAQKTWCRAAWQARCALYALTYPAALITNIFRYALNIKGLPYRTIWVDYCDIQAEMAKLGAKTSSERFGRPVYTLPTIYDPNTGSTVSEPWFIAEYLDTKYPNMAVLMSPSTRGLQSALLAKLTSSLASRQISLLTVRRTMDLLTPASMDTYRDVVLLTYGGTPDQVEAKGVMRQEALASAVTFFGDLDRAMGDSPFIGGENPCFIDVFLASIIVTNRIIAGEDADLWRALQESHHGRWVRFMQAFNKWEAIV